MKTIGMLGGMSWQSTLSYYKAINQGINTRLGGFSSANICMHSVDFEELEALSRAGDWQGIARILSDAARRIERGGADFLILCTNTMHKVATEIESAISIPMLHIADATAEKLIEDGIKCVGLLGTSFTMQQDFYKGRLTAKHGLKVLVPTAEQQKNVHQVIYSELCSGIIRETSREQYLQTIDSLVAEGAEAVILGCTEIALLIEQHHTPVPLYDTTIIHARQAVEFALSNP
jgi:aspartate racemase